MLQKGITSLTTLNGFDLLFPNVKMQLVQMKIKIILKHLIQCEGVPTFLYYDYTVIMITITSVTVAFWWKLQLVVLVVIL